MKLCCIIRLRYANSYENTHFRKKMYTVVVCVAATDPSGLADIPIEPEFIGRMLNVMKNSFIIRIETAFNDKLTGTVWALLLLSKTIFKQWS